MAGDAPKAFNQLYSHYTGYSGSTPVLTCSHELDLDAGDSFVNMDAHIKFFWDYGGSLSEEFSMNLEDHAGGRSCLCLE